MHFPSPRVTVVMVTYNAQAFVAEAVASILAQSGVDFELLACDDCSTDRTWEIIGGFSDRRLRPIRRPQNLGEYRNRNAAIREALGDYLIFIDGDDYMLPGGLAAMTRALDAFPHAGFVAALPAASGIEAPVQLSPRQYFACQFLGPSVMGANFTQVLFRRSALLEAGGFDLRFRTGDTHIQLKLALHHAVTLMRDGHAVWRQHGAQASRALHTDLRGLAELFRYGCEVLDHPMCPLTASERISARRNLARPLVRNIASCVKHGKPLRAARLLWVGRPSPPDFGAMFAEDERRYTSISEVQAGTTLLYSGS